MYSTAKTCTLVYHEWHSSFMENTHSDMNIVGHCADPWLIKHRHPEFRN